MSEAGRPLTVTVPRVRSMKGEERIVCLTAYDILSGALAEQAGVDIVLVGDSMGNVIQGLKTTLPVTLEQTEYHLSIVRRAVKRALLVGDLPFGSYGDSLEHTTASAVRLMKAGAAAVKLEGALIPEIEAIVRLGIPVMGHLGMTPQSVHAFGGFKVQGKGDAGQAIVEAAKALEHAGCFSIVLELIPADLAAEVTKAIGIPTIGIGAGPHCDGEIQVFHDVLGLGDFQPRHTKRYLQGSELMAKALQAYADDVRSRSFPGPEQSQ